jgi:hypothetical protein
MLEPLAACGGMPELLTPKEVTSINSKGRFLTTGEPLPLVVFYDIWKLRSDGTRVEFNYHMIYTFLYGKGNDNNHLGNQIRS